MPCFTPFLSYSDILVAFGMSRS